MTDPMIEDDRPPVPAAGLIFRRPSDETFSTLFWVFQGFQQDGRVFDGKIVYKPFTHAANPRDWKCVSHRH